MILSSCHHHSLNNDCHCHCCCHCYLLLFATNLCIFHLDLSCLDLSCCLTVCLSGWISLCFLFYPVSLFFLIFSLFIFISPFIFISLSFLSLLMNVFLTHGHGHTHTYIHMNICSFLWLVHITSKARKWRIVFEW